MTDAQGWTRADVVRGEGAFFRCGRDIAAAQKVSFFLRASARGHDATRNLLWKRPCLPAYLSAFLLGPYKQPPHFFLLVRSLGGPSSDIAALGVAYETRGAVLLLRMEIQPFVPALEVGATGAAQPRHGNGWPRGRSESGFRPFGVRAPRSRRLRCGGSAVQACRCRRSWTGINPLCLSARRHS